jgi:hypothetical protein
MVNGYKWYTSMALKFKELEALAAARTDAWTPEGAPNLYAFSRKSGHVSWVCRVVIGGKRTNITIGPWPDVKADVARQAAAAIKALVNAGHGAQAIKNAASLSLDPLEMSRLVTGERVSKESKTPTFETIATEWYEKHLKDGLSDGPYKRVNGGVKMGHVAAQNWATLGLRGTRVMGGGQSAALSM